MTYAFGTSKSDEYQTLTRVGAAYLDVAIMIDHILKRYHWHKTAHIYHSLGQENISPALCFYVMDTLGFLLKHHAVDFKPIPIDPSKGAEHFGEKLLHEVGTARSSKVSVSLSTSTQRRNNVLNHVVYPQIYVPVAFSLHQLYVKV